ncbi:HSR1-like GTP-binding protein [Psychromonas sp. CNPT3]|uniref:DUF3482 domain-containing protein n=1 Tax=Psychromonas sp. CNPT3 TaxID=314282 RepID=UPI00006E9CAE|nr:DUF3482 domain-containing protein [Psychromonas sp. CNPT3]AGH80180.1 HSR1-like GTP-binding protein [Psychromonas sp. CNPT3]
MISLSVAVVGHTNAGKTSLIRTLLRDVTFGEVADSAGTTRHVEGGALVIDASQQLALYDTPGLEDSSRLLEVLDSYFKEQRVDGIERLQYFLEHITDHDDLQQEAKVLRTLLTNDLIFYVIDVRAPTLGKYRDELQILSYAAKPIIPVLNFIKGEQENTARWVAQLARLNFHAYVGFDNVNFKFSDELKIYHKMQTLLAEKETLLSALIAQRQVQWQSLLTLAKQLMAELIIECGALRYSVEDTQEACHSAMLMLQKKVRVAESACVKKLLALYQFRQQDLQESELSITQGAWQLDLFSGENIQEYGLELGSLVAKGAGVGLAIDLAVGGITLGAAALSGGIIGAVWSVKARYYDEIHAKIKGERYICLDLQTLQVLYLRQLKLLHVLQQRGHASLDKIEFQVGATPVSKSIAQQCAQYQKTLHRYPQWSSLNAHSSNSHLAKRQKFKDKLVANI